MLPQAGQGADYVEGCSSRSVACFKCGAQGHWARDCPGLPDPPAQVPIQIPLNRALRGDRDQESACHVDDASQQT